VGIVVSEEYKKLTMPVEAWSEIEEEIEPEPKEVRVKVVYDWSEERVVKEIQKVFPDVPIMIKVAKCESEYDIYAYNPTNNSHDTGVLQISKKYHGERAERLGYDLNNPIDNLAFGRLLYDQQGLAPWIWSKHCWNK